ncbi:tetratricopeptide repeat protein [Pseudomonas frederiksbergensis]|uniref:Uncharacterized protein n=1 Tax=Pseudomonas frederiksbergensis TaxID=104087 RepID=A0A423HIM9_9PSED|nr:hypothetical protein [Pseudomonas frederiksbergensis]RON13056.1 hypothetical protein BK662_29140 [Pseudomonas frederiksbergensis]
MSLTADELIEKAKDQRVRKRYKEALVSAMAAAEAEPDNASAWWHVALSRWDMGDANNVIPALRKTLELAPQFTTGWVYLGRALMKVGEKGAKDAFMEALECDSDSLEALEALSGIYANEDNVDQDDEELLILTHIEMLASLSNFQINRFGILNYRNNHFFEAIKYWQQGATFSDHPASLYNLGLAYSHPEISQDADAVDMWRLTSRRFPDYEPPIKSLSNALPRLQQLASNARLQGDTLLPKEQWYTHYLNPFELLNPPNNLDLDDFDSKAMQRLKKSLLQEIDLEDGIVSWIPGITIDKSKAIGVCEELNNERKRAFHWYVFQNKPLLAFLCKGAHEHFLVDELESHLDTIELLNNEDNGFREWLSDIFASQFDRVLSKVIDSRNFIVLECLLDGRRWVASSRADICFENARRLVDRLLDPLRKAKHNADSKKYSTSSIREILETNALVVILNLLPAYFRDYQNDAVTQIRSIAISCSNSHGDSSLAREMLQLTKVFRFKSIDLNQRLEEDFEKIEELILEERKDEAKLSSGSESWEITKEGVKKGERFIAAADVHSVRWGALVTRDSLGEVYDFFFVATSKKNDMKIIFSWKTKDITVGQKYFGDLINAAINYLLPQVMRWMENQLQAGLTLHIGPCKVSSQGIKFETSGWIFTTPHLVPWRRVRVTIENGDVIVSDEQSRKVRISLSLREVDNAPMLSFLANTYN